MPGKGGGRVGAQGPAVVTAPWFPWGWGGLTQEHPQPGLGKAAQSRI